MVDIFKISINNEGWGPVGQIENVFPHIPYAPFSKADKLGKAADWTPTSRQYTARPSQSVATAFNTFENEDEEDFSLVDTKQPKKTYGARKNYPKMRQTNVRQKVAPPPNWQQPPRTKASRNKKTQNKYYQSQYQGYSAKQGKKFNPSIDPSPSWGDPVQMIEFQTLQNLEIIAPPQGETLKSCGRAEKYNELYDKIVPKSEKTLEKETERKKFRVTTSSDPIINKMSAEKPGDGITTVYATDTIISVLMCTIRSMYSWDIKIRKVNGVIFLDKREDSGLDYLTVNENATEPPLDEDPHMSCNNVDQLHQEATYLNFSFSQQLLLKDQDKAIQLADGNPFTSEHDLSAASVIYRYRKFDLGDGIEMIVRTEVDGYRSGLTEPNYLVIKALNEYDTKITGGWRSKLETQKAGCFATEVKNNGNKLTKWAVQAHLAAADEIKLGYVSRIHPRDPYNHVILSVNTHTVQDFIREIGTHFGKLWTVLKFLLGEFAKLKDGSYFIMREGSKKQLLIYNIDKEEEN